MNLHTALIRTGLVTSTASGVVLTAKAIQAVGFKGSFNPRNYGQVCKDNPVATAFYVGGLALHFVPQFVEIARMVRAERAAGKEVPAITYGFHVPTDEEYAADMANSLRIEHDADLLDELTTVLGMQYIQLADGKDTVSYRRGDRPGYDQVERQLGELALAMSEFDLPHVRRIVEDMVANTRSEVEACGRFFRELLLDHDEDCDCAKIDLEQIEADLDSVEETLDRIEAETPKQAAREPFDPRPFIKADRLDGSHPCTKDGCSNTVEFDDEPWCFLHSPDSGSNVAGYSYAATKAALAHLDEI